MKTLFKNISASREFFLRIIIFFGFLSFAHHISCVWFENRYLVPDLCITPLVTYRRPSSYITIQPFIISSDLAYSNCFERSSDERIGVYELGGQFSLTNLNSALLQSGVISSSLIKTEWLAAGLKLPAFLGGRIDAAGFAWNIGYAVTENLIVGWAAAGYKIKGMLQLQPILERNDFPLTESYMYEYLQAYKSLTTALNVTTACYSQDTFSDNDVYLRYEYYKDYCLRMRTIKGMFQIGTMIPTAQPEQLSVLSSIPAGSDKHWGLYASTELDLILKEDVTLSFFTRLQYNLRHIFTKRVPILQEPLAYGAEKACVSITPGLTGYFSPALTLEGIREGLGCKLAYSVVAHGKDDWQIISPQIPVFNTDPIISRSSWAQEHFLVAVFYDFMRDKCERSFEPFIGFTAQIPVDWLASKNAARSYALSCVVEVLY